VLSSRSTVYMDVEHRRKVVNQEACIVENASKVLPKRFLDALLHNDIPIGTYEQMRIRLSKSPRSRCKKLAVIHDQKLILINTVSKFIFIACALIMGGMIFWMGVPAMFDNKFGFTSFIIGIIALILRWLMHKCRSYIKNWFRTLDRQSDFITRNILCEVCGFDESTSQALLEMYCVQFYVLAVPHRTTSPPPREHERFLVVTSNANIARQDLNKHPDNIFWLMIPQERLRSLMY